MFPIQNKSFKSCEKNLINTNNKIKLQKLLDGK